MSEIVKSEDFLNEPKKVRLHPTNILDEKSELDDEFLKAILKRGLVISGGIGCGKTELMLYLIKEISQLSHVQVRVYDIIGNCRRLVNYGFAHEPVHSDTKVINDLKAKNIIFDLTLENAEERAEVIKILTKTSFNFRLRAYKTLNNFEEFEKFCSILSVVEEANTILNTATVKDFWVDYLAMGRNYKMTSIFVMQRMADSSTKAIERIPNFAFGMTKGANDLLKIKGMVEDYKVWKTLRQKNMTPNKLDPYEFLMFIGDKIFKFKLEEKDLVK